MDYLFSASELFDVAIEIEKYGYTFYRQAAEFTQDEAFGRQLLELADMEIRHEATFTQMKKDLVAQQTDVDWFDPDGEAVQYLRAFAEGNVFNITLDASKALSEQTSAEDILRFAIDRERDSVMFFVGLMELVPKHLGRDKIGHIIKEEMAHVAMLNRKIEELRRAGN